MTEVEEKITTEPEEAQEKEEEKEEKDEEKPPEPPEAPEAPAPKKKPATKKPKLIEIPVDPPTPAPAPAPTPAASSTAPPAPKARGRPKGAVGAAKRSQAAEPTQPPPTPREPEQMSPEDHVTLLLRHSWQMQEARRTAVREKYRSWVV